MGGRESVWRGGREDVVSERSIMRKHHRYFSSGSPISSQIKLANGYNLSHIG